MSRRQVNPTPPDPPRLARLWGELDGTPIALVLAEDEWRQRWRNPGDA